MEPSFARDNPTNVDVTNTQADSLFRYQLTKPFPRYLDELSFFVGGLVNQKSVSKKMYKTLVKHNLIAAVPEAGTADDVTCPTVYTNNITKEFAKHFYFLSVHAQRRLVGLMFFWEEECMRWRILAEEEREILLAMDQEGENSDLGVALAAVEMKKKMMPSIRAEATVNVSPGVGHALPSYQ